MASTPDVSITDLKSLLEQQQASRIAATNATKANVAVMNTQNCISENTISADEPGVGCLIQALEQVRGKFSTFSEEQRAAVNGLITSYLVHAREGADAKQLLKIETNPDIADQTFSLLRHDPAADLIEELGDLIQVYRADAQSKAEENQDLINQMTAVRDSAYEEFERSLTAYKKTCEANQTERDSLTHQIAMIELKIRGLNAEIITCKPRIKELYGLIVALDNNSDPAVAEALTKEAEGLVAKNTALEAEIKSCNESIAIRQDAMKKLVNPAEPTFNPDDYPIPEVDTDAADKLEKLRQIEIHLTNISVKPDIVTNKDADSHNIRSTERLATVISMCLRPGMWSELAESARENAKKSFEEFCDRMTGCRKVTRDNVEEILENFAEHFEVTDDVTIFKGLAQIFNVNGGHASYSTPKLEALYWDLRACRKQNRSAKVTEEFENL